MSNILQSIDPKILLKNLQDLNDLSKQVSQEIEQRNKILEAGLNNCKNCQTNLNNKNIASVPVPR